MPSTSGCPLDYHCLWSSKESESAAEHERSFRQPSNIGFRVSSVGELVICEAAAVFLTGPFAVIFGPNAQLAVLLGCGVCAGLQAAEQAEEPELCSLTHSFQLLLLLPGPTG